MSHDKLNILYFHYHIGYGRKTYQDGDITQGTLTQKFTGPINEVVI